MLSQPIPRKKPVPLLNLKREVRSRLVGYGLQEIITYSLVGLEMMEKLAPEPRSPETMPLRMTNPMTADQEYLRTSLRSNLLAALSVNRRHEDGSIRLFELDKIYLPRPKGLPDEREMLCGILSGPRLGKSWHGVDQPVDFFDAKGVVEGLLRYLGVDASFEKSSDRSLHPDKQAALVIGGNKIGVVGELNPRVAQTFEISEAVCLFEVDISALLPFTLDHKMFQPIPRYPRVIRDIALLADIKVTHQQVENIIKEFTLVKQVTLFDVYSGEKVPQGKKSLAYRITFQSPDHTLTDKETDKVQQQILNELSSKLRATLRA
jgi:phenylalanyl-tRNA synthetase beta chain